jgi:hypothetical protein
MIWEMIDDRKTRVNEGVYGIFCKEYEERLRLASERLRILLHIERYGVHSLRMDYLA